VHREQGDNGAMAGQHRKDRLPDPAPELPPDRDRVLAIPAGSAMTIAELRDFIADVELAAIRAGTGAGPLRPSVAVRHTGAIKGIWVRLPRS
jgi:hypothetical protein